MTVKKHFMTFITLTLCVLVLPITVATLTGIPNAQASKASKGKASWFHGEKRGAPALRWLLGFQPKVTKTNWGKADQTPSNFKNENFGKWVADRADPRVQVKYKYENFAEQTELRMRTKITTQQFSLGQWGMRTMYGSMAYMFGVMATGSWNPMNWVKGGAGMNHGDHSGGDISNDSNTTDHSDHPDQPLEQPVIIWHSQAD